MPAKMRVLVALMAPDRYWDGNEFGRDLDRKFKGIGLRARARSLRCAPNQITLWRNGKISPNLETYCRILAVMGREPGAYIRGVKKI